MSSNYRLYDVSPQCVRCLPRLKTHAVRKVGAWVLKGTVQHLEKTLQAHSILCQSENVQTHCGCVTGRSGGSVGYPR